MAIAYDVNINLGSQVGCTLPANSKLVGYAPEIQTTSTLNGDSIPYTGVFSLNKSAILSISASTSTDNVAPSDFIMSVNQTSTFQTLYLKNKGNAVLTITNVLGTASPSIVPIMNLYESLPPFTIQPGAQIAVSGAYYAYEAGIYDNYFVFESNSVNGWVKVNTHQVVGDSQNFRTIPENVNTTTDKVGQVETKTYTVIPIFNYVEYPNTVVPVTGTISGSDGWRILNTGTNSITVEFDSNAVDNINGIYTANLTISVNGGQRTFINTATVTIDHAKNKNLSKWISPASHYNSIVGISYDLENDQRILTIGVGMGGDDKPIYGYGGKLFADVNNLGLGGAFGAHPYPFWSKVYQIPFTGEAKEYHSSEYVVKTTTASDYSSYFGEYHAPGSMFIVEDDGYGSLKIEINHLRDFDPDLIISDSLKATLKNITRAFYYYSDVDILGRYTPLPTEYSSPNVFNTATTNLFVGFNYNTRDKLADINTSIVELPI